MCIIIHKPAGVKMPSEKILRECFMNNPDGAGYMVRTGGKIQIRKGFFDIDSLLGDLKANIKKTDDAAIHFRIATHGTIIPGNCHPFPITSTRAELHVLSCRVNRALMHNGSLSGYVDPQSDISDSGFFAKMLYPCRTKGQYESVLRVHNSGSRFVVMTVSDTIRSGLFHKYAGCYYSNYSYRPFTPVKYDAPTGILAKYADRKWYKEWTAHKSDENRQFCDYVKYGDFS